MPFQPGNKLGGRHKGKSRILADKALEYIRERVAEEIEPIMDALISKAKEGDISAIRDLFDRAFGKAKETIEHQGLEFLFDDKEDKVE